MKTILTLLPLTLLSGCLASLHPDSVFQDQRVVTTIACDESYVRGFAGLTSKIDAKDHEVLKKLNPNCK